MESKTTAHLSCRAAPQDTDKIDALVSEGAYMNRSDFLRAAIRQLLAEHA